MAETTVERHVNGVGDAAVRARTGKGWDEWLAVLDADGQTTVDALFYDKGPDKSQIALQHSKLPNADEAAAMKAYWGERLDALKALLES